MIYFFILFLFSCFQSEKFPASYKQLHGKFEIHVTVSSDQLNTMDFEKTCLEIKEIPTKAVLIELPYGHYPNQLMTSSSLQGDFFTAYKAMKRISHHLEQKRYKIIREKIEIKIQGGKGIPKTHQALTRFPVTNYFEYHLKIAYDDSADLSELALIASKHQGHFSQSVLKQDDTAYQKRFITLRFYNHIVSEADYKKNLLIQDLRAHRWNIVKIDEEYGVYDSGVFVDKGWIDKLS